MAHLARIRYGYILLVLLSVMLSACNLSNSPEQQLALTEIPTNTPAPTRTLITSGNGLPTTLPITQVAPPTSQVLLLPTSNSLPPTFAQFPTNTPTPISIVILSPIPGNVVAGNVQVLGAAIHPLFLQYQLEYGPDPNPGNLWYPASGISQNPVFNGLLGIWNTTLVQDSVYQLRLRVTLRDGTSLATVVNGIRIQNQAPTPIPSATPNIPRPIAAFTQDHTTGQAPLVVRFINQSSGNITNFAWAFGDGGSSAEANPVYTFRSPGVFYVTLQVTGPGGSSNVTQQINVQSPSAPVAAFTQDKTSGPSPLTVKFTNQSTGIIASYNWTFGDGTTSLDPNPTHQFVAVGTYNVILSLVGPGGTSFVTRKITVQDPVVPPPVAGFVPDKTSGNIPLTVQFNNQSTGQITSFSWDFGDGQTSVDKNPTHVFTTAGDFTVKLTAIGPGGQHVAQTKITAIKPPDAPVAAFTQSTASGDAPLTVQFTNQSSGNITGYSWDFGDSSPLSTDKNPSHIYSAIGTFAVKLKVSGPGGTSEAQSTVTSTKPIAPPVAAFTVAPNSGTAPLTVQFTNQSTGESLTYSWDFGDSTSASTDANPSHTYAIPGAYPAKLTVTNAAGSNTSAPQTITVNAAPVAPVASFTMDTNTGTAPLTVTFTSTSTGDFNTLMWSFADSANNVLGTANTPSTSFTFPTAGTYTATLKVDGLAGSNTSAPQTITVNAAPVAPVASFTMDTNTGTAPLTVNFTSTSTGDFDTLAWTFADASNNPIGTANSPTTSFTFPAVGTYTATLAVSGSGGSNTSAPQTITVNAAPVAPLASFTMDTNTGTAPLTVNFTSTSTGDFDTLAWTFADASNNPIGTANTPSTSFTFPAVGTYTATLAVSGSGGSNTSAPQTITVNAAPVAPLASFTMDTNTGTAPLTVNFTSTSTGDFNTLAWSFADTANNVLATANTPTTSFTFPTAGTYTATLTVDGLGGSNTSAPQTITVNAAPVVPVPPPINKPLAFVSNRSGNDEIYIMGTDGTVTNISNNGASDTSPSWSSDGNRIAFVSDRDGNEEIYVMNADGSNVVRLTNNPASDNTPVWTQSDTMIDFATSRDGNYEIYSMNADGSNPINLTNAPSNETNPAASLDGKLAYMSDRDGNNEIYVTATDGTVTNVTNSPSSTDSSPSWAPGSKRLVFVSDRESLAQLYIIGADGSNPTRISDLSKPDTHPAWSLDGSQIAFISQDNGLSQIYVMNSDGTVVSKVSDGTSNDSSPAWKP